MALGEQDLLLWVLLDQLAAAAIRGKSTSGLMGLFDRFGDLLRRSISLFHWERSFLK